jgi:hypothetical protein
MTIKKVTTVHKILRIVDLSILRNRAAENFGKFCKILSLKRFNSFSSLIDRFSVFLVNM